MHQSRQCEKASREMQKLIKANSINAFFARHCFIPQKAGSKKGFCHCLSRKWSHNTKVPTHECERQRNLKNRYLSEKHALLPRSYGTERSHKRINLAACTKSQLSIIAIVNKIFSKFVINFSKMNLIFLSLSYKCIAH